MQKLLARLMLRRRLFVCRWSGAVDNDDNCRLPGEANRRLFVCFFPYSILLIVRRQTLPVCPTRVEDQAQLRLTLRMFIEEQ
jgi:hypothetical protein